MVGTDRSGDPIASVTEVNADTGVPAVGNSLWRKALGAVSRPSAIDVFWLIVYIRLGILVGRYMGGKYGMWVGGVDGALSFLFGLGAVHFFMHTVVLGLSNRIGSRQRSQRPETFPGETLRR